MEAEDCVVWLRHRVGDLGRRKDGERLHDASSHTGASAASESGTTGNLGGNRSPPRLLPNHIQHRVDEFGTLGVLSLRQLVVRALVSEHNVVWPEVSERSRANAVHGSRIEVHENRADT